ncbi:MAG TPA: hypothetical protein ENI77_04715 [Nitrospirae bacterium]|nr:hypothetical protein [Nitrospirota bacterium]
MKIHLISAVWGDQYTDLFLNVCLPNQLTPGNLRAFGETDAVYKIYTSSKDAETILDNRFYKEVESLMPTQVVALDHLFRSSGHSTPISILLMTQCHKAAIDSANMANAILVFLPPDQVYSEGAFARLIEIASSGKRAVTLSGVRLSKETFVPAFKEKFTDENGHMPSPSRDLVELALGHLHPITASMYIDAKSPNGAPTHLYWKVGAEGFVARCLHLHPLLLNPVSKSRLIYGNFDTDYFQKAAPLPSDYYIVTDSDDITAFEMSPVDKSVGFIGASKFNIIGYARFLKRNGHHIHKYFLTEAIRIHSTQTDDNWEAIDAESSNIIQAALALAKLPDSILRLWAFLLEKMR